MPSANNGSLSKQVRKETDLYAPIKSYWESRGFEVRAEVRHCDVVVLHPSMPEHPIIIEMKASINLTLLLQAMERLKISSDVYIAAEQKRGKQAGRRRLNAIADICRRLGLGLMTVTFYTRKTPFVEVFCHPSRVAAGLAEGSLADQIPRQHKTELQSDQAAGQETIMHTEAEVDTRDQTQSPSTSIVLSPGASTYEIQDGGAVNYSVNSNDRGSKAAPKPKVRAARQSKLLREFAERSGDYNVGGSTKRPLMTAYREKALRLAAALAEGPNQPARLREQSGVGDAAAILQHNYYGWFERTKRGVYTLTPEGTTALERYADVLASSIDKP
ncbi:DUF2161 family putative PD-(D/E)XK-type phosphodiesterase [Paenibacillus sp. ACRRX]|uniref:DUF2161 family putative PD-(D/E)XK-type phosphodiesterase n=1 Tax=Paenibacillus sp. ACRRX TaxID=2918206 RepID=UPI001EF60C33|nr:DUF2161 family putative PD-(D/E)XK-type phosphodiesterase [Paenibacillus sp. ACRRX]MCG7409799.1 DUF2161 family putative PD-(D/E)XK-type phosphodiesterase [Paenibacillus sp. ACRRX]